MTNVVYQITRCTKQYFDTINFYIGPFNIYSIDIFNKYSDNNNKYRFYKKKNSEEKKNIVSSYWYLGHKRTNEKLCKISFEKQQIKVGDTRMDINDIVSVKFLECFFVALKDLFKNSDKSLYHTEKCERKAIKLFFTNFNLYYDQ